MIHQIYISVGSNIDRQKHTVAGLAAMHQLFGDMTLSNVYESEAVGFKGKPFYNLVVGAVTELSVIEVGRCLKQIENQNGRQRDEKKFAPRTLDLDLLLYDHLITRQGVALPRDEIEYNAFVLLPLSEIAPQTLHPIRNKTIATLWQEFDNETQKLWKIPFNWSPVSS